MHRRLFLTRNIALALAVLAGCGATEPDRGSTSAALGGTDDFPFDVHVASRDARLDVPSFVWLSRKPGAAYRPAMTADAAALGVLHGLAGAYHLSPEALSAASSPRVHDNGKGALVVRFAQSLVGVDVFRASLNVALRRDGEPVAASGWFAPSVKTPRAFSRDASESVASAFSAMTGETLARDSVRRAGTDGDVGGYERFTLVGAKHPLSIPARSKKVWFPHKGGLEPGHYVELMVATPASPDAAGNSFVVSAADGSILFRKNLVASDAYTYRAWAGTDKVPMDGPQGNGAAPHPTGTPDGIKLTFVASSLVTLENFPFSKNDPWLAPGAATTVGNNVDAYADIAEPDGFSPDTADRRPTTTTAGVFDHSYDTHQSPGVTPTNVDGATTHLFYMNNFMHDWFYDSGFDEKSGNHQAKNFGRGGKGGDPLLAEAQDFSGRNNANASTPADGESPRMQMYIFNGASASSLTVTSPTTIAGIKKVGIAGGFGAQSFTLSGTLVLAEDGAGVDLHDACEPITNGAALAGKIALIHRGNCDFAKKTLAAQQAGATAVVIASVATSLSPNVAPPMGGEANGITIPALSVSQPDGAALEGELSVGVAVTLARALATDLDGALDSAIVSHEWGHVLSNRLVADGSGLNSLQAGGMGEGWSDFVSLLLMTRSDDTLIASNTTFGGIYPTGAYATSGGGEDYYFGIRRVPYSVNFAKNPLTYKHIQDGVPLPTDVLVAFGEGGENNSEVHNTGEVWATMLWECYVSLLRDKTRLSFPEAQERMKAYLVAGLKLTPPDPTILEARDAILAATYAADSKDFVLFSEAFARRGAGTGATGPDRDTTDNSGVVESFLSGNDVVLASTTFADDSTSCDADGILDNGETGTLTITVRNAGVGALSATTATVTASNEAVVLANGGVIKFGPMKPYEKATGTLKISLKSLAPNTSVDLTIALADPSLGVPRTIMDVHTIRCQADEVPASSATDAVDPSGTVWKVSGDRQLGGTPFKRVAEGLNQRWSIPNNGQPSDQWLESPPLSVMGTSLAFEFRHRWWFESNSTQDFDGGVLEMSVDGGLSWTDIGASASPGYGATLDNAAMGSNPLKGRKAFGNKSAGYPAYITTKVAVDVPQGAKVSIRFRAGSDDNSGDAGWDIDDLAFTTLTDTPFASFQAQRDMCSDTAPTATAMGPGTVTERTAVKLTGTGESKTGANVTYAWTQTAGPTVKITGDTTTSPEFTAPEVAAETTLTFALRVSDGAFLSSPATVDVIVQDESAPGAIAPGSIDRRGHVSCQCRMGMAPGNDRLAWLPILGILLAWARRRTRKP